MFSLTANVRTVALISHDSNGNYGAVKMKDGRKRIGFRVAVKTGKIIEKEDGTKEEETEFCILNAFGKTAEYLNDFATDKKEDGKLISRQIQIRGQLDFFDATGKQKVNDGCIHVEYNGDDRTLDLDVENDDDLYVKYNYRAWSITAERVEFLDSNPSKNNIDKKSNSSSKTLKVKSSLKGKGISLKSEASVEVPNEEVPEEEIPIGEDINTSEKVFEKVAETEEIPISMQEDFGNIEAPFN